MTSHTANTSGTLNVLITACDVGARRVIVVLATDSIIDPHEARFPRTNLNASEQAMCARRLVAI